MAAFKEVQKSTVFRGNSFLGVEIRCKQINNECILKLYVVYKNTVNNYITLIKYLNYLCLKK